MTSLTGTRALLRLALRRDRITVPIWLASLTALLIIQMSAIADLYDTPAKQLQYAQLTATSAAARMFGAIDGVSLGSIFMVELYGFLGVLVALMSYLLVVRHTRQDEQTGRLELIGSTVVGRRASLAAAGLLALIVNAMFALIAALTLITLGLPATGASFFAIAMCGIGITFAGIGAVTAQIADSSRAANGAAGALLGLAFLLRGFGDVFGRVTDAGTRIEIAWPSWLSPLGWGQLAYPFGEQRWAPLALYVCAVIGAFALAFVVNERRDLGHGLLAQRPGRVRARQWMLSPVGLAVRQQRPMFLGWLVGLVITGATLGAFSNEIGPMLEGNQEIVDIIVALGGTDQLTDAYYAVVIGFVGVVLAVYLLQAVLRLREEELDGHAEHLLATATSRTRWLLGHSLVGCVGTLLLLVALGISIVAVEALNDQSLTRASALELIAAVLVQMPAILVVGAAAMLAIAGTPRHAALIAWSIVGLCAFLMFGSTLKLPEWLLGLSPYRHLPVLPSEPFRMLPVLGMLMVAALLVVAALARVRGRDLQTR